MYRDKRISLVIPAYNEEKLIKPTLEQIPEIIDRIYVIDDCSPDDQCQVIMECAKKDERIVLIKHKENQGPGGAIITGYIKSSQDGFDIAVVAGGDFQMPLNEVENLLNPIIDGQADYAKGNKANMISVACKGCGVCGATCYHKAIKMNHFTDQQVSAQIAAVMDK